MSPHITVASGPSNPRALPGEDCVCLIATTHHLRPHGWLGRLVRPLLGM